MTAQELNSEGVKYWEGTEVEQDFGKALEYYHAAAKLNYPKAFLNIGICYMNGQGVEENKEKAFQYFCKAGELGNADGLYNAAVFMRNGIGTEKNEAKSLEWTLMAAEKDNAYALNYLGDCYYRNDNKTKAYDYYSRSSMLGNPLATINTIAHFLYRTDRETALAGLNKAIEQNTNGQFAGIISDERILQATRVCFGLTKLKHRICSLEEILSKTREELYAKTVDWYSERYPLINFSIIDFEKEIPVFTAIDIYERGSSSFVMPYNNVLRVDLFDDFPYKNNIREFIIDRNFDYDDDKYSHFHSLPNLEKFTVIQPSPFSVEDGVLYIDNCDEMEGSNILFDFTEKPQGRVLVAFPPNHPAKKFVIPSDVVAICNSAFAFSKLEELTIPDSVEQINYVAFVKMEKLQILRVPNKMIKMYLDHYDTEPIDFDLYSNNEDVSLDDEVVKFWNEVRNLEPHFDWSHYWYNTTVWENRHREFLDIDDTQTEGRFIPDLSSNGADSIPF